MTQTDNIEIRISIAVNCIMPLELIKNIFSKDGGPFVYQTRLGWCIFGSIHNVGHQNSLKCNEEGSFNW